MKTSAVYKTKSGSDLLIRHVIGYSGDIKKLLQAKEVDCIVIECEDGFSQLGEIRSLISEDLGLNQRDLVRYTLDGCPNDLKNNISSLADWCMTSKDVTLVAVPSNLATSQLKGIVLCPYDAAESYKKYSTQYARNPYRDFMYSVTYEALLYATKKWKIKNVAITHFSRSKMKDKFNPDTTTCQLEAVIHCCNEYPGLESVTFLDNTEGNNPIQFFEDLQRNEVIGIHRPIKTSILEYVGVEFVKLNIPMP